MKFTVQKLPIPEFDQLEQQIIDSDKNLDQMHETWKILDDFFSANNYENDPYWRNTYFRIYVRLTWKIIGSFDVEKFAEIIRRQTPMALLLDVDVEKQIMWFLGANSAEEKQAFLLYQKLKEAFLQSDASMGVWQGKNVTVADLVKEINSVYSGGDSLAQADFESRLRQIMFPADEMAEKYFTADPEEAKERFFDLVSFFQTFTQEEIWYVVDGFLNPEKYQTAAPSVSPATQAVPAATPSAPTAAPVKKPAPVTAQPPISPAPAPKPDLPPKTPAPTPATPAVPPAPAVPSVKPAAPAKPTLAQIKSEIEKQFKKDAAGNFKDVETVLTMLSTLAERYNDPKIADMLYYDEKENKFKWNT